MSERKNVESVLAEPKFDNFDDRTYRVRKNLIVFSLIMLFKYYKELDITVKNVSFLEIKNLDNSLIDKFLFLVIVYHLIYFVFIAWEHFKHNRIRITGSKLRHVTTGKFASQGADYPDNPMQSSLYSWWVTESKQFIEPDLLKKPLVNLIKQKKK